MELRCGKCNYWLGESTVPLVNLGTVAKSSEAVVKPPRDLRVCKSCGSVNVLVARKDLGIRTAA
jgi:hypothetical protein